MAKVTIKKSEQREIQKFFSRLKEFRKDAVVNARLGNLFTGELKIGNRFYATIIGTGQVVKVVNNVAPSKFRWPVKIGYTPDSRLLQVLETWNIYDEMTAPNLPAHSSSQQWPEPDTLFVRGEQFFPGLFIPSTGLILAAYAFVYYLDDAYHLLPNQEIDLSSEVPVSGANYVLLEVDADRNLQFTAGATVDTRKLLRAEDIPSPSTGFFPLVAVKMYEGQTSFIQSVDDSDITDLRWAGFGGGTLPTLDAGRVVVTDASGNIVTVDGLRYDPTYNCLIVGNHARLQAGTGDIEQFAPDGANPTHVIDSWGGVPARIIFLASGTEASPTTVISGQVLDQPSVLYTYNGTDYAPAGRIRAVATEDHTTGERGIKWELWACPIGSTTEALVATFDENGINMPAGTAYMVDGTPVGGSGGGITWSIITADQSAVVDNGYICNKGTLLTLTLPTTSAVNTVIRVAGMNAGLWKIAQNASQKIHFGNVTTTTGTGGSLASVHARDAVELICVVADLEWNVISSVGNITVV